MGESANVVHQNRGKRRNAFEKFVPVASPSADDGAPREANPGHDNHSKRHKLNSEAPLSEIGHNFSNCSPLPKQIMGLESQQHSTPSTSSKHSPDSSRSSPSSIASKLDFKFEALDGKSDQNQTFSPDSKWKEDHIELGSVYSMAAEQLAKRPKVGEIYKAIAVHRENTAKRLKDLCKEKPTADVGIEMADAACLLKLMSSSTNEIETAGQKAHRGAMLLLQAEMLHKNGLKLLAESQNLLGHTLP